MMHDRGVWHLIELPKDANPVGCRWVFTVKKDETGKIARFKARLVAQGFKQIQGESYDDTFSPVVNFSVIRFFFSLLVSLHRWLHIQCDIKCAYLYAPLNEKVFMSQPPGFVEPGKENLFCKLNKAIYGLHQSGRMWFYEINRVLLEIGFVKIEWCNCGYVFGSELVLLLYVDDIVVFGKCKKVIDKALDLLSKHFDLKVLGKTRKLLGVEFEEDGEGLRIHQQPYIEEVCNRFESFKFPISSLPISKGSIYSKSDCPKTNEERNEMSRLPYRSVLGCLSFISNRTRPDISYAINIFSQFQSDPGMSHWHGLLRLLGYVKHTKNLTLKLSCDKNQLITFSDADFASNRDDRTSLGGQVVFLGNSPISWRTFKERSVSLSTMEAEFIAMTEATKELIWFDRIFDECFEKGVVIGKKVKSVLYVDNRATIDFVRSPIENHRSRHIDVKLFFVRDLVNKNIFDLCFIRSKENVADIFTKPATKFELTKFIQSIFKC